LKKIAPAHAEAGARRIFDRENQPYRIARGFAMLALTDDELAIIQRFASPLHPNDRSTYLERVSQLLKGREIGPGLIHRACEQAQRELRRPAELDGRGGLGQGKYAR
jgi:hypothetical protein